MSHFSPVRAHNSSHTDSRHIYYFRIIGHQNRLSRKINQKVSLAQSNCRNRTSTFDCRTNRIFDGTINHPTPLVLSLKSAITRVQGVRDLSSQLACSHSQNCRTYIIMRISAKTTNEEMCSNIRRGKQNGNTDLQRHILLRRIN